MRAQALTTIGKVTLAALLLACVGCKKAGAGEPGASGAEEQESSSGGDDELATPNGVVHESGGKSASAVIGPPGGTLEIASGAKVEIPPGTFEKGEEVTIADAPSSTAYLNSEHLRPIGPVFTIAPSMEATNGRMIRVSIPLGAYPQGWGDVQLGYEYMTGEMVGAEDAVHTQWQTEGGTLSGGRAVAEVPALPGYRLQFVLSNLESQ